MLSKIKYEFSANKKYTYIAILLSLFTTIPSLISEFSFKHIISMLLLTSLLILLSKFSKTLFSIFIIYLNILNIIALNIFIHWGGIVADRLEVETHSPLYEKIEYLHSFVDYRDYFVIIYSLFIIYILYKYIRHFTHSYKIIAKISIVFSIILVSILQNYYPLSLLKEYIKYLNISDITQERTHYLSTLKNKHITDKSLKYDKIIIIQGESSNKHHLALYGYHLNTTPFLSKLFKENKLYKFNAIAPSNQTRYSVPMIFTKANVSNWEYLYIHSKSIVSNFKELGYDTYWLSNQGKVGQHNSYITNIASESNHSIFFNKGNYKNAKNDIVIVDYLKNIKENRDKEMFVFHLIGSHSSYRKRYPKDKVLNKEPKNQVEEYDNSIYFTDYVIKNIIKKFDKKGVKVLVVYLSDHSEVVNLKDNLYGHGFLPAYKAEYDIPFVVYSTVSNPRLDELYKANQKNIFNLENANSIIKYISYISDEPNISTSLDIFSVMPKYVTNYNKLKLD